MFRPDKLAVIATTAALTFAACGGGGSAPTPAAAPHSTTAPQARTPIATGTLSIMLPPKFVQVTNVTRATDARTPQWVDPTPGRVLDIYIGSVLASNLDGSSPGDSLTTVTTSNGAQTATIPLYSSSDSIVVIEWNSSVHQNILALGTVNSSGVTPGSANNITLTMQLNAQYMVASDQPGGTPVAVSLIGNEDATPPPGSPLQVGPPVCITPAPPAQNTFFAFQADGGQNFIPVAGYAGTLPITASPVTNLSGTSTVIQISPGVFNVAFDALMHPANVHLSSTNPAWAIAQAPAVSQLQSSPNNVSFATVNFNTMGAYLQLVPNLSGC